MNYNQANKTPITKYLQEIGINPSSSNGNIEYYKFTQNKRQYSFSVDIEKNTWFEKETRTGGNLVELVMKLDNVNSIGALLIIQKKSFHIDLLIKKASVPAYKSEISIEKIQDLKNSVLINFLESRRIPCNLAQLYLKEAYFLSPMERKFFGLCHPNDDGGMEIMTSKKNYHIHPHSIKSFPGEIDQIYIFEDILQYLSYLAYFKIFYSKNYIILLNGCNPWRIANKLKQFNVVNLVLTNDKNGRDLTRLISKMHKEIRNWSRLIFPDHRSMNDFWVNHCKINHNIPFKEAFNHLDNINKELISDHKLV